MPQLGDLNDQLLRGGVKFQSTTKHVLTWVFNDNVLEVAVGLIIAASFTAVVKSLVADVITPLLSLLPFLSRNFEDKFAVLRKGPRYDELDGYNTVAIAHDDGAVVLTYGNFFNELFSLMGIGLALYVVSMAYGAIANDNIIKNQVKCKTCRKRISEKAKRCSFCTTWQDGRED